MRYVFLMMLVALAGACRPQGGNLPEGAANARAAVEAFLTAARTQDMQAMAAVWGNQEGSARRRFERSQLERRVITLMCYFNHESYRVLSETPGETQRMITVELQKADLRAQVMFTTVRGPGNRWFVLDAPVTNLQPFCATPSATSAPPPPEPVRPTRS